MTVAADACFVAKHVVPDRTKIVLAETLNPQVRQVVKTYAPGFGLEVVEVPHRGGTTDPEQLADAAARRCSRALPAAELPRAASSPRPSSRRLRTRRVRSRSHTSTRCRSACSRRRAAYGCAMAIGEGQSAGNWPSYGGPHYGFLAARKDFIRRMPGRIVGETVDLDGKRAFVLTLQTREQHIRREKATSNITTNQTLLALAGLATLSWLGPAGAARGGGDVPRTGAVRAGAGAARARFRRARIQGGRVPDADPGARGGQASARARRASRATRSGATTRGWTTCCSSP